MMGQRMIKVRLNVNIVQAYTPKRLKVRFEDIRNSFEDSLWVKATQTRLDYGGVSKAPIELPLLNGELIARAKWGKEVDLTRGKGKLLTGRTPDKFVKENLWENITPEIHLPGK
jgi:hypothetical protein